MSFSKMKAFKECGIKFYWYNVAPKEDRVVDPGNKYTEEGEAWHKDLELYVLRGEPMKHCGHLPHVVKLADKLRNMPGRKFSEIKMGIDENGTYVPDFFNIHNYIRGIIDFMCISEDGKEALVIDYKAGKRIESKLQLMICAAFIFARFSTVEKVTSQFQWLKTAEQDEMIFHRHQFPAMLKRIKELCDPIIDTIYSGEYEANPEATKCKWCRARDYCKDRM